MALYVLKFGGASVSTVERLRHVAGLIENYLKGGHQIVVVVSAMAGVTDHLVELTQSFANLCYTDEHDAILCTGEQVSASLLALALQERGVPSCSYAAWQLPIITESCPGNAKIRFVNCNPIKEKLSQKMVPIICGFQGISPEGRLTTLGRGGSDLTAIALGIALKADRCDLYKDVDGIYTANPKSLQGAQKITSLSYSELIEMSAQGAQVLQERSIRLAQDFHLPISVLSSFENKEGTSIGPFCLEKKSSIAAIVSSDKEVLAKVEPVVSVPDCLDVLCELFGQNNLLVKGTFLEEQNMFSIEASGIFSEIKKLLEFLKQKNILKDFHINEELVKISLIGQDIPNHFDVLKKVYRILAEQKITIYRSIQSYSALSFFIKKSDKERVLDSLHNILNIEKTYA